MKKSIITFLATCIIVISTSAMSAYTHPHANANATTISANKNHRAYTPPHQAHILTLKDAVYLSLRFNPNLQSDELGRITEKYSLVVAKNEFELQYALSGSLNFSSTKASGISSNSSSSNLTPSVKLKTKYGTQFELTMDNPVNNQSYNPELALTVTQPLIQGFGKAVVEAALKDALDQEKQNKLQLKGNAITTINSVINTYIGLIQAQDTLKTDQLSLENYQRTVKNDRIMITAGRMPKFDIVQPQARVAQARVAIQRDLNTIHQAYLSLLDTIGLPSNTKIKLPEKIDFDAIAKKLMGGSKLPNLETCKKLALTNNTTYQAEGISLRSLERSIATAKDQNRWQLDLTASATQGGGAGGGPDSGLKSLTNHRNHSESIGLNLSVPIDDVDAKQALIGASVALDQAGINYREQKRQLEINTINDRNTVLSNKEELRLAREALKLQAETVNIAEMKKKAGRISTFELLDNQRELTFTRQTVINNQISYIQAIVAFDQNLGTTLDRWDIKIRY